MTQPPPPASRPAPYVQEALPPTTGRVALVMAVLVAAGGFVQLLFSLIAFRLVDFVAYQYGLFSAVSTFLLLLLAIATLVVGVTTARRGALLNGGIAIGAGGVAGISCLLSLVVPPVIGMLPF